jgi:hypothetical protein
MLRSATPLAAFLAATFVLARVPGESLAKNRVAQSVRRIIARVRPRPEVDGPSLVSYNRLTTRRYANPPKKLVTAQSAWLGDGADELNVQLQLGDGQYVYFASDDLRHFEESIETLHRPLEAQRWLKRSWQFHIARIDLQLVILETEEAVALQRSEVERLRTNCDECDEFKAADTTLTQLTATLDGLRARHNQKMVFVSQIGRELYAIRQQLEHPIALLREKARAERELEPVEEEIARLTMLTSDGWTFRSMFAGIVHVSRGFPLVRHMTDWLDRAIVLRAQRDRAFVRIPAWRLQEVLGGLKTPEITLARSTRALRQMVDAYVSAGVPVNKVITDAAVLDAMPNFQPDIEGADVTRALLRKHIEYGGTFVLTPLTYLGGVALKLRSSLNSFDLARQGPPNAVFNLVNGNIGLNVANPEYVAYWEDDPKSIYAGQNASLRHECSHSAIARAQLVPSRFLATVMAQPREGIMAFNKRVTDAFENRLNISQLMERLGNASVNYMIDLSVTQRLKYASTEEIIADLDRSFELLIGRPLRAKTRTTIKPLIDDLREGRGTGRTTWDITRAVMNRDLLRSVRIWKRSSVNVALYKAAALRVFLDEVLAHRISGDEINHDFYLYLDQSQRELLDREILPNTDHFLLHPEIFHDFEVAAGLKPAAE